MSLALSGAQLRLGNTASPSSVGPQSLGRITNEGASLAVAMSVDASSILGDFPFIPVELQATVSAGGTGRLIRAAPSYPLPIPRASVAELAAVVVQPYIADSVTLEETELFDGWITTKATAHLSSGSNPRWIARDYALLRYGIDGLMANIPVPFGARAVRFCGRYSQSGESCLLPWTDVVAVRRRAQFRYLTDYLSVSVGAQYQIPLPSVLRSWLDGAYLPVPGAASTLRVSVGELLPGSTDWDVLTVEWECEL